MEQILIIEVMFFSGGEANVRHEIQQINGDEEP